MRSSVSHRLPLPLPLPGGAVAGQQQRPQPVPVPVPGTATATIPLRFLHTARKPKPPAHTRPHPSPPLSASSSSVFFSSLPPNALLSAGATALHNQQLDTVLQIFRTLQKHPIAKPNISAYNLLLGCSACVGDADTAVDLVRRVCQPVSDGGKAVAADADTLLHLFTALVRDQRSEDVLQLLSDLDSASKPVEYTKSRHPTAITTTLLGTFLVQPTTLAMAPSLDLLLRITHMFANRGQYDYGRQTFTLIHNRFKTDELQLHAHDVLEVATTLMRLAVGGVSADKLNGLTSDHVLGYWRATRSLLGQLLHSSTAYHISNTELLHTYSSAVRALCRAGNLGEAHAAYRECIQFIQLTTAASTDVKQRQKLDALLRQPESTRKLQSSTTNSVDIGSAFERLFVNNPDVPAAHAIATGSRSSSSTAFLRRLVQSQAAKTKTVSSSESFERSPITLPAGAKRPVNLMLRSMIKACSLLGQSQLAERVFSDFHRVSCVPTSADYEQLLLSYAPWRQSMQRTSSAGKPADSTADLTAEAASTQQTVHSWFVYHHRARTLYKEMLQAGVQPTPAFVQTLTSANASSFVLTTPATAADALSPSNHLQLRFSITDSVQRLLRQITARGYTPDQVMLQSLMASYLRVSAPWHALHACTVFMSQWNVQPTSDILTVLAATGEKLPAGETRVKYYAQYQEFVRTAGLQHLETGQTFLHWLRALTGSDSTNDMIQQILGQAMDQQVATIDHFHVIARSALKAPAQWSSWRFVIRLFYGVVSANPHTVLTTGVKPHAQALVPIVATYDLLLRTAAKLTYAGDAMNLYSHMQRQSHIEPTASTIASVLHAAVLASPQLPAHTLKSQLRSLLRDMQSQRLSVDEVMECVQETDAKKQAIRETLLQATKDDSKLGVASQTNFIDRQRQTAEDELADTDLVLT